MSGIEVVGLVLGAFPLLISAAEHYKKGFEPLVKWKRFRSDFLKFLNSIAIEKHFYDMMLEHLLISADVQQEDMRLFTTDPHYDGWQRKDTVNKLKIRLGSSFDAFMSTIQEMNELMFDLKSALSLKNGQIEWASDGTSKWDYQMKRIHYSFSKKGTRALASLEIHNRKLRELVDSSEKLDTIRTTKKEANTTWADIFECVRQHAISIHTALRSAWTCDCASHITSLLLERRKTEGWASTFNLAFSVPQDTDTAANIRRELVLRVRNGNKIEKAMVMKLDHAHYLHKDLDNLRPNFENRSASISNTRSPSISPSLFSVPSTTASNASSKECIIGSSKSSINVPSTNGTEYMIETKKTSFFSGHKIKIKKSVKIQEDLIGPPAYQLPAPTMQSAKVVDMPEIIEIKDLCLITRSVDDNGMCLGYVSDGEKDHELYFAPDISNSLEDSYISLETLLSSQSSIRLSQKDRYQLSSILASSLLQLQNTPWLGKMEKKNIYFYQQGTKILLEKPYIRHQFLPCKRFSTPITLTYTAPSQSPSTRFAVRNSLSDLGILLLELCFGQAIEDQEIRKHYLGQDGRPHQGTDYMTARDWAEMVWDEDPAWESIIKCCIFCMFEEKADWGNKKFMQAVYLGVVEPLEKIISKWAIP